RMAGRCGGDRCWCFVCTIERGSVDLETGGDSRRAVGAATDYCDCREHRQHARYTHRILRIQLIASETAQSFGTRLGPPFEPLGFYWTMTFAVMNGCGKQW